VITGLHGDDGLLDARQELLGLGQRQPQVGDVVEVAGGPSSISSTLRVPPSARVSTSCNTKPIHDPPAGNGPAGHIAPSAHPQSLDTPLLTEKQDRLIEIFVLHDEAIKAENWGRVRSLETKINAVKADTAALRSPFSRPS